MPVAVQGTCCWKWLLCPSGCSCILHSSWVAEAAAASEQVKDLGRIGKMAMKKERETGRLSQPSLCILHCTVPWVLPIPEGSGAISHINVQHPLKVSHEAVLHVS